MKTAFLVAGILALSSTAFAQEPKVLKCDNGTVVALSEMEGSQILLSFASENAGDPDVMARVLPNGDLTDLVTATKKLGKVSNQTESSIEVTLEGTAKTICRR